MKRFLSIALVLLFFFSFGCTTLSHSDKAMLRELESYGIPATDQKIKNAGVAGGLNILPGVGNFYLAAGTDQSDQWVYGFLNLLFWPLSIVWGIPEAAIDANTINKMETVYFYRFDQFGKMKFEELKNKGCHTDSDMSEHYELRDISPASPEATQYTYGTIEATTPEGHETVDPAIEKEAAYRLNELQKLKDNGLITEDEYQAKRAEIIDGI